MFVAHLNGAKAAMFHIQHRAGAVRCECDLHLGFDPDSDPGTLNDQAASFFDAGVDIVVWSMRGPMDASRLAPLAAALR